MRRNSSTDTNVIRPFETDSVRFPTMRELEVAEREARAAGATNRALAYRLVRVRRLRQAQAEARRRRAG